ncbi:hypothetical protein [Sporosarcina sp. FA9]|uniref:hypothetical protein n=1 Tax=Sporosarcina sp. FA9 TaxID=3413030 RepID=UPI003F658ABC
MHKHIINQLILVAGAWKSTGRKDKHLERQFSHLLNELRWEAGTTPEGALDLLLRELGEKEVAA